MNELTHSLILPPHSKILRSNIALGGKPERYELIIRHVLKQNIGRHPGQVSCLRIARRIASYLILVALRRVLFRPFSYEGGFFGSSLGGVSALPLENRLSQRENAAQSKSVRRGLDEPDVFCGKSAKAALLSRKFGLNLRGRADEKEEKIQLLFKG